MWGLLCAPGPLAFMELKALLERPPRSALFHKENGKSELMRMRGKGKGRVKGGERRMVGSVERRVGI